jgi:hypothetical protein
MAQDILARTTTMTWAGDVAKLVAKLVLNNRAYGEDYNVVTSEHHTWAEVANIYQDHIGLKIVPVDLKVYINIVQNEYPVKYDRLYDRCLDNAKVLQATGIGQSEFASLREGLGEELRHFKENPYFQYPHLSINARMDRALGTKVSLSGLGMKDKLKYHAQYHCVSGWFLKAYRRLRSPS